MKILGYVMLHYGSDYLGACLESLSFICNKIFVIYQLYPSHNGGQGLENPDTRGKLYDICAMFPKAEFIDVYNLRTEGQHRGVIWGYTPGYDILINADSDEIWEPSDLERAVNETYKSPYFAHGISGFVHFWRSFNYIVYPDWFRPVRLYHLREKNRTKEPEIDAKIYHFGYAIKPNMMNYKISIHGHRGEWKQNWINDWLEWKQGNNKAIYTESFHPTSNQIWTDILDFDKSKLPEILKKHEYFNKEII